MSLNSEILIVRDQDLPASMDASASSDLALIPGSARPGHVTDGTSDTARSSTRLEVPIEDERSYPLLIQTYIDNNKAKIFQDARGLFTLTLADYEYWTRFGASYHPYLPAPCSVSTQTVNLRLSSSYAKVKETINTEVPVQENREVFRTAGRREMKVALSRVTVIWNLPGGGIGYTHLDDGNCGSMLELIAARGWRDILVASYFRWS